MLTIGQRIKYKRTKMGLSVETLAALLGKNRATVYRYESDYIEKFPTDVIVPLSMILNTTPAYLMGWETADGDTDVVLAGLLSGKSDEEILSILDIWYKARSAMISTIEVMTTLLDGDIDDDISDAVYPEIKAYAQYLVDKKRQERYIPPSESSLEDIAYKIKGEAG